MLTAVPISIFLNTYLIWFDSWFPMFGNLTYALLSLYLLACTGKGCFKIGMRFLCIKIHPMEPNKTYSNAFLFNVALILLCTVPLLQFCSTAFAGYTRASDIYLLFQIQIYYLDFFGLFFSNRVFVWIILLTACVTLPYLAYQPRDSAPSIQSVKESLQRRDTSGYMQVPGGRKE